MEVITGNGCLTWDMVKSICDIEVEETESYSLYKIKIHNKVMEHTWNLQINSNHLEQYKIMMSLNNAKKTRYEICIHKYIRESQLEEMLGEIKF